MALRFCGQPLSGEELELIEGLARSCRGLSRTELASTAAREMLPEPGGQTNVVAIGTGSKRSPAHNGIARYQW